MLIRNAWPSRLHVASFEKLQTLVDAGAVRAYNPPSRTRGYREDKSYLVALTRQGREVVLTFATRAEALQALGQETKAVYKPVDGASGQGVRSGPIETLPIGGGVYQPFVSYDHEVSFSFVDDVFCYALKTAGATLDERWELSQLAPSAADLAFAQSIVEANALAYGIQRIDAFRLFDGRLLLNEIEDFMPFLSLKILASDERNRVLDALVGSILEQFDV